MVELLRQLAKAESNFKFNADKQRAGLKMLLEEPGSQIFLVEIGGMIAGMATLQRLISTQEGGPVGRVEDVVIHRNFRGKGIGKQLLQHLKNVCEARGYLRMQLLADETNANGESFYASQGLHPTNFRQWRWYPGA